MYPTLLKNRILAGFWFYFVALLASVLAHSHCVVAARERLFA